MLSSSCTTTPADPPVQTEVDQEQGSAPRVQYPGPLLPWYTTLPYHHRVHSSCTMSGTVTMCRQGSTLGRVAVFPEEEEGNSGQGSGFP